MDEMEFNSIKDFYDYLRVRGGATRQKHGSLGMFYEQMTIQVDPNACSCKKGKRAMERIVETVGSLSDLRGIALVEAKKLVENRMIVINHNGRKLVTF